MSSSISTVSQTGPCFLFVCRSSCKKLFTWLWTLKKVFSSVPIFFRGADAYYDHKRVFDYHITSTIKKRTQFSQLSEVGGSFVYFAYRKPQVNFVLFAGFRSTLAVCGTTLLVKSDRLAFLKFSQSQLVIKFKLVWFSTVDEECCCGEVQNRLQNLF